MGKHQDMKRGKAMDTHTGVSPGYLFPIVWKLTWWGSERTLDTNELYVGLYCISLVGPRIYNTIQRIATISKLPLWLTWQYCSLTFKA